MLPLRPRYMCRVLSAGDPRAQLCAIITVDDIMLAHATGTSDDRRLTKKVLHLSPLLVLLAQIVDDGGLTASLGRDTPSREHTHTHTNTHTNPHTHISVTHTYELHTYAPTHTYTHVCSVNGPTRLAMQAWQLLLPMSVLLIGQW